MRDGIHKDLPLPRGFKAALRSCANAAERGDTARSKLTHALARQLLGVSPGFLARLRQRANDAPGLPGLLDSNTLSPGSVLEGWVAKRFVQLEASGVRGDTLLQAALAEGLGMLNEAFGRQVRQHCAAAGANDAAGTATATAYAEAAAAVDLAKLATDRIAGERPARAVPRRLISLEEDLTGRL